MSFDSLEYWALLIIALPLILLTPNRGKWLPIATMSYLFYGYWNPYYCFLLLGSTFVDYAAAIKIETAGNTATKKLWLYLSLFINVGVLILFKSILAYNGKSLGDLSETVETILIPIGISFYTFQTMGYTIDVYRKEIKAERHFGYFAAFISFFPQLIAGPIERYAQLMPQLKERIQFNWSHISAGTRLIIYGLFKKLVIADNLLSTISYASFNPESFGWQVTVLSAIGFGIWAYIEFSSYTELAIGSAKLFGVDLSPNFKRPLFAISIRELWRRWHITLTNWIFHYIYQPLRLSFLSNSKAIATIFVFGLIGLWHGFTINYLLFGLYFGVIITIERWILLPQNPFWNLIKHIKTFALYCFGVGYIFYSKNLGDSLIKLERTVSEGDGWREIPGFLLTNLEISLLGVLIIAFMDARNRKDIKNPVDLIGKTWIRWGFYYFMLFMIICFSHPENVVFAYFQF